MPFVVEFDAALQVGCQDVGDLSLGQTGLSSQSLRCDRVAVFEEQPEPGRSQRRYLWRSLVGPHLLESFRSLGLGGGDAATGAVVGVVGVPVC